MILINVYRIVRTSFEVILCLGSREDNMKKFVNNAWRKLYKLALKQIREHPYMIKLPEKEEEEDVYFIEEEVLKIQSRKKLDGKWYYEVHWVGGCITWEPLENLDNCKHLLSMFLDQQNSPTGIDCLAPDVVHHPLSQCPRASDHVQPCTPYQVLPRRSPVPALEVSLLADDHSIIGQAGNQVTFDDGMDYFPAAGGSGQTQQDDDKPRSNPTYWNYEQLVGELCRRDRMIKFEELGPLMDNKVDGDALMKSSFKMLRDDLGLAYSPAVRVLRDDSLSIKIYQCP